MCLPGYLNAHAHITLLSPYSLPWCAVIKEVNTRRNNLFHTRNYLDNIFTAIQTAKELSQQLDEEDCNLLEIHSRVSDLETCRDELMYYGMKDDNPRFHVG